MTDFWFLSFPILTSYEKESIVIYLIFLAILYIYVNLLKQSPTILYTISTEFILLETKR